MPETQRNKPAAIVLIRLSALGDVAMTVPAVYDLCHAYPDKTVVMVTRTWMGGMFVNAPDNLVVEGIDPKKDYKGVRGMYRLARYLRGKYDIEAFIDLHDVLRTRILRNVLRLYRTPVSVIDKGRKEKKRLVELGAKRYVESYGEGLRPTVERYRDAIGRGGYEALPKFESLFPKKAGMTTDKTFKVGLAPFAAHEGKVYPLDRMAEVVDKLASEQGVEIYLFGAGEKETAVLDRWVKSRPNVINMAARRLGLAKELELMSELDVMVAMDSGNMHMASIAGVPKTVSIWGATHTTAGFIPFRAGSRASVILEEDLDCRPCSIYGNQPCRFGDYRCLRNISPQRIVDTVLSGKNK